MRVLIQMKSKKSSKSRSEQAPQGERKRRRPGRWLLGSVLLLDLVVGLIVFPGSLGLAPALAQSKKKGDPPPKSLTLDAIQLLGKELDARTEELILRENQMADAAAAKLEAEQAALEAAAEAKEEDPDASTLPTPLTDAEAEDPAAKLKAPLYTAGSLRALGEQLVNRAEALKRREAELDEALRAEEVLRRSGVLEEPEEEVEPEPEPEPEPLPEPEPDPAAIAAKEAFARLQQAYEKMEPESAAIALSQLAARDREAVVALLNGWKPRTSGAILDALTQSDPALAADLSYEIYKRGKDAE